MNNIKLLFLSSIRKLINKYVINVKIDYKILIINIQKNKINSSK